MKILVISENRTIKEAFEIESTAQLVGLMEREMTPFKQKAKDEKNTFYGNAEYQAYDTEVVHYDSFTVGAMAKMLEDSWAVEIQEDGLCIKSYKLLEVKELDPFIELEP